MNVTVTLIAKQSDILNKFLNNFFETNLYLENKLTWSKKYQNPIEIAEIIGTFIDNNDFLLKMWISIDKNVFINITSKNANDVIKYLFERFPY